MRRVSCVLDGDSARAFRALLTDTFRMFFLNASYKSVFALASAPPPSADHWCRQLFSLWFIVSLGGLFFYLFFAALSYRFMYDERLKAHPKVLHRFTSYKCNRLRAHLTARLSS